MEYKILITIIMVAVSMVTATAGGTTTVFADKSPYDSGFSHGREDCQDIKSGVDQQDVYYFKSEYGPNMHTTAFNDGFRAGWYDAGCAIQDLNHMLYLDVPSNNNVVTNADDIITKTNTEINTDQEQNQAASTHQNGSCGTILIGDCVIGQRSDNTFAANAEN